MKSFFEILKDTIKGKVPFGLKRSPRWRAVRDAHLKLHPECFVCGGSKKLEVHHIVPFHLAPAHELDTHNLMTLCENGKYGIKCHQLIGHLGNYRKFNPQCVEDARTWRYKLQNIE